MASELAPLIKPLNKLSYNPGEMLTAAAEFAKKRPASVVDDGARKDSLHLLLKHVSASIFLEPNESFYTKNTDVAIAIICAILYEYEKKKRMLVNSPFDSVSAYIRTVLGISGAPYDTDQIAIDIEGIIKGTGELFSQRKPIAQTKITVSAKVPEIPESKIMYQTLQHHLAEAARLSRILYDQK